MADELDTTQLIAEVHRKPLLYSKADQDYLNKAKKDQTWERIAAKFGTNAKNVRTKWSYLRDKFVKELRRSTQQGGRVTSWPHFQSMMFVRESSKRKSSAGSTSSTSLQLHHAPPPPPPLKAERMAAIEVAGAAAAPILSSVAKAPHFATTTGSSTSPRSPTEHGHHHGHHNNLPQAEPQVKALIAEIHKWPLLYNRDDPDYQNKQRKEECWQSIAAAMKGTMTMKQMKSKWTYLRDKLVKELKKNARTRRKMESGWIYFDSMAFVRDANKHYTDVDMPTADGSVSYSALAANDSLSYSIIAGSGGDEIDVDLLISEILKRPLLYDPNDEDYRDEDIRNRVWEEIAALLGDTVTIDEVQDKWASLRERFAKELLRTSRATNRGVRVRRRWEHFDKMMMLNECVESRSTNQHHSQPMKFEPPLHLNDDDEYLNAAYLCADFAHINGDQETVATAGSNSQHAIGSAVNELASTPPQSQQTATANTFLLTPLPLLNNSSNSDISAEARAAAAHGNNGNISGYVAEEPQAAANDETGADHLLPAHQQQHIEQAVLRMVDIISQAVLSKRDNGISSTAAADADDRSGNEPFLEYVRHYLRHTSPANNVELKRLVTQFMHSNPTNGAL